MITGIILFVTAVLMFIITIMELRRRVKERRKSSAIVNIAITSDERHALKDDMFNVLKSYVKIEGGDIRDDVEMLIAAGVLAGLKYAYGKKESTRNDGAGTDEEEIEEDGPAANGNMQGLHV